MGRSSLIFTAAVVVSSPGVALFACSPCAEEKPCSVEVDSCGCASSDEHCIASCRERADATVRDGGIFYGTPPEAIVRGRRAFGLQFDATHLYWLDVDNDVFRARKDGSSVERMTSDRGALEIVATPSGLFALEGDGALLFFDQEGAAAQSFAGNASISDAGVAATSFLADDANLYLLGKHFAVAPIDGGAAAVVALDLDSGLYLDTVLGQNADSVFLETRPQYTADFLLVSFDKSNGSSRVLLDKNANEIDNQLTPTLVDDRCIYAADTIDGVAQCISTSDASVEVAFPTPCSYVVAEDANVVVCVQASGSIDAILRSNGAARHVTDVDPSLLADVALDDGFVYVAAEDDTDEGFIARFTEPK